MNSITIPKANGSKALRIFLWTAQVLVAVGFISAGAMKGTMPIPELAKSIAWAGDVPVWFVRTIAVIDLAGGIGILLPALTRILPHLTVWAALGCSVLQVLAMMFHLSRGEGAVVPINIALLGLSLFVLWGRSRKAPVQPRA